jgi:hypothetical protein
MDVFDILEWKSIQSEERRTLSAFRRGRLIFVGVKVESSPPGYGVFFQSVKLLS